MLLTYIGCHLAVALGRQCFSATNREPHPLLHHVDRKSAGKSKPLQMAPGVDALDVTQLEEAATPVEALRPTPVMSSEIRPNKQLDRGRL